MIARPVLFGVDTHGSVNPFHRIAPCECPTVYHIVPAMTFSPPPGHPSDSSFLFSISAAGEDETPGKGGNKDGGKDGEEGETGVATKTRTKAKKPSMYKVLLLNDDYTPMEFVVIVLKRFFKMDMEQATRVMLHVHQKGVGVCGVFSYEVAETKVNQVMDFAKENQHPLQCTLEKA